MDQRETSDELNSSEEEIEHAEAHETAVATLESHSQESDSSSQSTSSGEGGEYKPPLAFPEPNVGAVSSDATDETTSLPSTVDKSHDRSPSVHAGILEKADFEQSLRKRIDERQKIIDARNKRLDFENNLTDNSMASVSTSELEATKSSPSSVTESPASAVAESLASSDSPKKINLLDRIAAVFKPNPTS
jgi:hypothetical protein